MSVFGVNLLSFDYSKFFGPRWIKRLRIFCCELLQMLTLFNTLLSKFLRDRQHHPVRIQRNVIRFVSVLYVTLQIHFDYIFEIVEVDYLLRLEDF